MAEKINIGDLKIETYADKPLKTFSLMQADEKNVCGLGSAAAACSASAAALALRALRLTTSDDAEIQRAERDMETLRSYFVHLTDEENKAKKPLEKLLRQENPDDSELEAAYRTACCVIDEVFYMSVRIAETLSPVAELIGAKGAPFASAALHLAECSMDVVRVQKAAYSTKMNEPVFARTTRREPEIAIENNAGLFSGLIKAFEDKIK